MHAEGECLHNPPPNINPPGFMCGQIFQDPEEGSYLEVVILFISGQENHISATKSVSAILPNFAQISPFFLGKTLADDHFLENKASRP